MKVLPVKLRRDSLSAHTDQTRFLEGEAGNRTQSDSRYGLTLVLMGISYDETDSKKATYALAGRNTKNPVHARDLYPAEYAVYNGKSKGFWRLK